MPPDRPTPTPIDPKRFLGGENIDKLKGLLRDVDDFAKGAKERAKDIEETFKLLKETTVKFSEVVDKMNGIIAGMSDKMKES